MAYGDSSGENVRLLRRTITGVADFSGRARRTEVIYYWIASALIGVVINFAAGRAMSFEASLMFGGAVQLLLMIPMFALFVRRVHDQNRSGWWGILLPLALLPSIPRILAQFRGDILISQQTTPLAIAAGLCALAVLVLSLLSGTDGANGYGPDPRLEES